MSTPDQYDETRWKTSDFTIIKKKDGTNILRLSNGDLMFEDYIDAYDFIRKNLVRDDNRVIVIDYLPE